MSSEQNHLRLDPPAVRSMLSVFDGLANDLARETEHLAQAGAAAAAGDPHGYLRNGLDHLESAVAKARMVEAQLRDVIRNSELTVQAFEQHDALVAAAHTVIPTSIGGIVDGSMTTSNKDFILPSKTKGLMSKKNFLMSSTIALALKPGVSGEKGSFWDHLLKRIREFIKKNRERGSVSEEDARKIFDDMADEKDIPYQFPDDGCYARAHEMVKRISERYKIDLNDITKVFIVGNLEADTPYVYEPVIAFHDGKKIDSSTTDGTVNWGWHVAPIIKVRQGDKIVDMVIDPSLADAPITIDEWKNIMKDPNAEIRRTDYKQYNLSYRFDNEEQKQEVDEHSRTTLDRYLKPCIEKGYCEP